MIFGDKGCADKTRKQQCRAGGLYYGILDQATRQAPLSDAQEKRNRQFSSVRSKVEHPFQVIKCQWHCRKVRYRGLAKNTARLFALFGLANLFKVRRQLLKLTGVWDHPEEKTHAMNPGPPWQTGDGKPESKLRKVRQRVPGHPPAFRRTQNRTPDRTDLPNDVFQSVLKCSS